MAGATLRGSMLNRILTMRGGGKWRHIIVPIIIIINAASLQRNFKIVWPKLSWLGRRACYCVYYDTHRYCNIDNKQKFTDIRQRLSVSMSI